MENDRTNSGGPEAGARGAGAVGVGGCAWLHWQVAGLRCVSLARLRCARTVWAAAGLPPGSDLFPSGVGVGGGSSPAPAGRVSEARRSARHGVPAWPPARGVCSSRGGGGASDSMELPEDFRRNARRTARPTAGRSQSLLFARRRRRVRQQGASRGFSAKCSAHGTSDSKEWCASHMFLNGQRLQGQPPIECSV